MSTRIDKLFRSKLAEHTTAPSANAWARVEAGLSKKNNGLIWFRWAAVLLIPVLLAGILVLRRTQGDTTEQHTALNDRTDKSGKEKKASETPAKQQMENKKTAPKNTQRQPDSQLHSQGTSKKDGVHQETEIQKQKSAPVLPNEAGTTVAKTETEPGIPANETAVNVPSEEKPTESRVVPAQTAVATTVNVKPIVLEYTLGSTEPETPVEKGITLTVELKEKKGFQKVIDFALDAKNSEGPLATLRQAKHDLFAFNFKKDKHPK